MSGEQQSSESQANSWKLIYHIFSPNEVRDNEETEPMSIVACLREAKRIKQSLGRDYALKFIKVVNVENPQEYYYLQF